MKQKNKIRFLLVAVLAGVSVMGYAQGKWCIGAQNPYEIVQVTAPSDAGATFQWKKDGVVIPDAKLPSLTLPTDLTEGKYTYIRYAQKPDCPDLVASNAFTVEVLTCGDIASGDPVGTKGTFEDARDKKVYKIVKMPGGKVWMAENLNYQKDLTFNAKANEAKGLPFISTDNGAPAIGSFWCPPLAGVLKDVATSQNTCNVYGALYTWETAMSLNGLGTWNEQLVEANYYATGVPTTNTANNAQASGRGICPEGYHMPTDKEWAEILAAVDPSADPGYLAQPSTGVWGTDAGVKLKSASTYVGADLGNGAWLANEFSGTDDFGFGALPAGYRDSGGSQFGARGTGFRYWSSSVNSPSLAWCRFYNHNLAQVGRASSLRSNGFSVRCVRD